MLGLVKRWVLAMLTPYRTALRVAALPAASGAFGQICAWWRGRSRQDEEVPDQRHACGASNKEVAFREARGGRHSERARFATGEGRGEGERPSAQGL
jgi:hypothetical protein